MKLYRNLDKLITFNYLIQITSVEPLKSTYKHVQDIYLDYNHIRSIDILESDEWLHTFRIFSLKGNKLTKVNFFF